MNAQEIVENYVESYKSNFKKLFVIQSVIDIILIAILVFLIIKFMNNKPYVYSSVTAFIILQQATFYINMKKWIGGFKGLSKNSMIQKSYNEAVKQFNKTGNKAVFDEKISELELQIKEN